MRFGKTLERSIYNPWQDKYIDYTKLKSLLREGADDDDKPWTEEDENKFCDEILNVQLDKVATFQEDTLKSLEKRADDAAEQLKDLAPEENQPKGDITVGRFQALEKELDKITEETKELKKFSSINYTGFFKIVKKHDRKRGNHYSIRPMLQVRLAKRPFNSEAAYNPLINKLSVMYFVIRQNLDENMNNQTSETSDPTQNRERYTAYKFWVHPDNMLEVKTYILRHLPVLVFSQQSTKQVDIAQDDPAITSLYFDDRKFSLYTQKVIRENKAASSLRLRWSGQLSQGPELLLEQKIIHESGSSEERKIPIKDRYVQPFLNGEYSQEKSIQKMERQGQPLEKIDAFKTTVSELQSFISEQKLEPVMRANYTRTAFQKPLDDRVRVSIDTNLVFIREDSLDPNRPCRRSDYWHRTDIDNAQMIYPFPNINQGEISRFPYAVLEIKVREDTHKKTPGWVEDLMGSHLVHNAPQFSKFVHGVATLFEDHVNTLPSWLTEVETDIRKNPEDAFKAEEAAKAQRAETEQVVGSLLGSSAKAKNLSYQLGQSSPLGRSYLQERYENSSGKMNVPITDTSRYRDGDNHDAGIEDEDVTPKTLLKSLFPAFSSSRLAHQTRRSTRRALPPGVTEPSELLKNSGPLKIEPKVWLANERTFLKWQHISLLLGSLAIALYTAAGEDTIAEIMGIIYILIAVFTAVWGAYMHKTRRDMIIQRSGRDFDNILGPMIVSVALIVAVLINFTLQFRAAFARLENGQDMINSTVLTEMIVPGSFKTDLK